MKILFFIIGCILYLLSWVVVHLLCEYKFLICKGNCKKCNNWRCKNFALKPDYGVDILGDDVPLCSSCGCFLDSGSSYCSCCGRGVKWSLDAKR